MGIVYYKGLILEHVKLFKIIFKLTPLTSTNSFITIFLYKIIEFKYTYMYQLILFYLCEKVQFFI
jgi:hypothetical protein